MSIKIGIITINYNTENMVKRFIDGLINQEYSNWVLLIVNNSQSDIKIMRIINSFNDKRIHLLSINENIGYSKANNLGYKYLLEKNKIGSDDIILFSNEDIVIKDKSFLSRAIEVIKNKKCSFLGPKIINNDGSLMLPHLTKTGFFKCLLHIGNNGVVDKIFKVNKNLKKAAEPVKVFLVNGACFFCKVFDFHKVGMLDTNTFIYYQEELLFRKVDSNKFGVIYDPRIVVYHNHSGSFKKSSDIIRKKKFLYEGELYFLTEILKISKIWLLLFKFERMMEFLLIKLRH